MKKIEVTIEGTSPLLQHRYGETAEVNGKKKTRSALVEDKLPRDEAAGSLYRTACGKYYHPGSAIHRMLTNAGSNHKLKGTRKSARYVVPSAVRVLEEAVVILDPETNKPATEWEVDSRSVVIPATKGRIMRHRPRWDKWRMKVNVTVNDDILPVDFVHTLFNEAGTTQGLGDYRPERCGGFGCFRVIEFKE